MTNWLSAPANEARDFVLCSPKELSNPALVDWFYAVNGQQAGPVSEAQLDELFRSGMIDRDTLVWRNEMPDWQPLHIARPSAPPPLAASPATVACVECGRPFPQNDVVLLNQSWVCAQCKPMFLQRLREGVAPVRAGVWRSGRQIVMQPETPLPDRCIRCNAPANGFQLKRQLYWHPPAYYLLIIVSILIYAVVALCIRKKALIHIGLCEAHRTQRKRFIAGSWLAVLIGLLMLIGGIARSSSLIGVVGVVLLLGGAILGAVKGAVVSAAKIDKTLVWVKGAAQTFLADLPEWNGTH